MSSCRGALREPGQSLLVVEMGVQGVCLRLFGVSQVTDAHQSGKKRYRTLAHPGGDFSDVILNLGTRNSACHGARG